MPVRSFCQVTTLAIASVAIAAQATAQSSPTVAADSPRLTPLVEVINASEPAVVGLFQVHKSGQIGSGSGAIIHPDGFVLTNHHVVPKNQGFALIGSDLPSDQTPVRFVVIGRNPERDLAIVKLLSPGPFPVIPLGRSRDLLNGETVVAAGNPGGRGIVFTSGIVSAKKMLAGMPNAFVMTNYKNSRRPHFIQFDAASNGGNSGGPLINLEGDLIGIVAAKIYQEDNVGFAIPVDAVHKLIESIIAAELRTKKELGLTLTDTLDRVEVGRIVKTSAAATAGIEVGDIITAINGQNLRHRVDWHLALRTLLATGRKLSLTVSRGVDTLSLQIQPQEMQPTPAANVDGETLQPGLEWELYEGQYSLLPDFTALTSTSSGVAESIDLEEIRGERRDFFAINLTGYLRIPEDGLYRLLVTSDDGSQAYLHQELIIDNDGNHSSQGVGHLLFLQQGDHPLRVAYFQGNGDASLSVTLEKLGSDPRPLAGDLIWH